MKTLLGKLGRFKWHLNVTCGLIADKLTPKTQALALFDPSIESDNMGDEIITRYGMRALDSLITGGVALRLPTHIMPDEETISKLPQCRYKIVCGTNLMTPHFENYSIWRMPEDLHGYSEVVTMAVGWEYYCDDISKSSKTIYRKVLSRKGLHSVRDRYTERKFHEMGIHNVIYTGCVTLWEMTPERCAAIPRRKAKDVVTTITDYSRSPQADKKMLDILSNHYDTVYVWIQGQNDLQYLQSLTDMEKIRTIDRSVSDYEDILKRGNIDYVGTRLHAGIFAMNYGVRSIVIAIDNRAREMGRDANLVLLDRADIGEKLGALVESEIITDLRIPWKNIEKWKKQFK